MIDRVISEMVSFPGGKIYFKDENNLGWLGTIFEKYDNGLELLVTAYCEESAQRNTMVIYEDSGEQRYRVLNSGTRNSGISISGDWTEWVVIQSRVSGGLGNTWHKEAVIRFRTLSDVRND